MKQISFLVFAIFFLILSVGLTNCDDNDDNDDISADDFVDGFDFGAASPNADKPNTDDDDDGPTEEQMVILEQALPQIISILNVSADSIVYDDVSNVTILPSSMGGKHFSCYATFKENSTSDIVPFAAFGPLDKYYGVEVEQFFKPDYHVVLRKFECLGLKPHATTANPII